MRAVVAKLGAAEETGNLPATPGGVLKVVATTLMATVGGAGGPLLGTAFLRAARSSDASAWGTQELVRALEEATSGLEARGHATSGDKTMADAWRPAAVAAKEAAEIGEDEIGVLAAAAQAAAKGARDTEPLQARRGRASFLGERSCGHRDPGAQSSALILQAALDAACDRAFEDSRNIDATIKGRITEIKNPISGRIVADEIGRITYDAFAKGKDCVIETTK